MRPEEIEFLIELLRARAGYALDPEKTYLMETRLAPVARREGFGSIRELIAVTRQRKDDRLGWAIAEAIVCGETTFFRDVEPFARLGEEVLPNLAAARQGRTVRVFSAGCASGQEPYSVAMLIDQLAAKLAGASFEITAADLAQRALEKAHAGLYTQFEVQLGLPIRLLVSHFERREDNWQLSPKMRAAVRWRRMNLNADFRALGPFDLVLCRNILRHMDPPASERLQDQLGEVIAPDGYLLLGAGEEAPRLHHRFASVDGGLLGPRRAQRAAA